MSLETWPNIRYRLQYPSLHGSPPVYLPAESVELVFVALLSNKQLCCKCSGNPNMSFNRNSLAVLKTNPYRSVKPQRPGYFTALHHRIFPLFPWQIWLLWELERRKHVDCRDVDTLLTRFNLTPNPDKNVWPMVLSGVCIPCQRCITDYLILLPSAVSITTHYYTVLLLLIPLTCKCSFIIRTRVMCYSGTSTLVHEEHVEFERLGKNTARKRTITRVQQNMAHARRPGVRIMGLLITYPSAYP